MVPLIVVCTNDCVSMVKFLFALLFGFQPPKMADASSSARPPGRNDIRNSGNLFFRPNNVCSYMYLCYGGLEVSENSTKIEMGVQK